MEPALRCRQALSATVEGGAGASFPVGEIALSASVEGGAGPSFPGGIALRLLNRDASTDVVDDDTPSPPLPARRSSTYSHYAAAGTAQPVGAPVCPPAVRVITDCRSDVTATDDVHGRLLLHLPSTGFFTARRYA